MLSTYYGHWVKKKKLNKKNLIVDFRNQEGNKWGNSYAVLVNNMMIIKKDKI